MSVKESKRHNKYIDLRINGKLFPSWILANFKEYQLPEIIRGADPCNETIKLELRKYQLFLGKYLDFNSSYRDILLYHGLGFESTFSTLSLDKICPPNVCHFDPFSDGRLTTFFRMILTSDGRLTSSI